MAFEKLWRCFQIDLPKPVKERPVAKRAGKKAVRLIVRDPSIRETIRHFPREIVNIIAEYGTTDYHDTLLMMLENSPFNVITRQGDRGEFICITEVKLIRPNGSIWIELSHNHQSFSLYSIEEMIMFIIHEDVNYGNEFALKIMNNLRQSLILQIKHILTNMNTF
jgi:hypothetical protein